MQSLLIDIDSATEQKFKRLADQWRKETFLSSSSTDIVCHPAYLKIIGMGPVVVPLLLRELQNDLDHWFSALRVITEEDPVNREDAGNIKRMSEAWLDWGKRRGLV